MKHTKILTGSLFALGVVLFGPSSHAANSYNVGDLFIGFEQAGSANDYVIDIGPVSNYIGVTGSFNVSTSVGNSGASSIAADLSSVFGASWASNTQTNLLQWGVIGASSNSGSITIGGDTFAKNTLFLTQGEVTVGSGQQTTAPTGYTSGVQGTINTQILNFENDFNGSVQTANSNFATIENIAGDSNAWSNHAPSGSAFTSGYSIEQPTSGSFTGPTNSALDLYKLAPGNGVAGTYEGKFTLNSSGALTFTGASAVPEPASLSLLSMSAGIVLLGRWRRIAKHA